MKTHSFTQLQMDALEVCLRICSANHRKYGLTPSQLETIDGLHDTVVKSIATEEVYIEAEDIFDTIRRNRHAFVFNHDYPDASISLRKVVTKQIRYSNALTGESDTHHTELVDAGIQIRLNVLLRKLDGGEDASG
jgi:hypothetical protein